MKALLLAIIGLNLAFYLATNLNKSVEDDLSETDANIPALSILDPEGSAKLLNSTNLNSSDNSKSNNSKVQKEQLVRNAAAAKKAAKKKAAAKQASKKLTVASLQPVGNGRNLCIALGPFVDKDDAHELNEKLIALNIDSELKSIREKERFRVYLQAKTVNESPTEIVSAIRKKGLKYKLLQNSNKKFVVDFGWYKTSFSATKRMKQLRLMGFTPKFEVKGAKGEQIWVNYSLPRGKKLPATARSVIKATKQEVFFQQKNCTVTRG